jgi:hypothetical protein
MSMAGSDITIEILKEIRDAVRGTTFQVEKTNGRLDTLETVLTQRLDVLTEHVDGVTQRLDLVETTLLDLAEQNRFIVRYTKALAERHADVEPRVSALEDRVDKLESE